tara:strand:+ start:2195 stop:3745 length:1551 start_codon:yes stop_codon:yes gene_type:complete
MKSDKKLPNLKVPVKGKKGVSKFMRKKVITKAKDDLSAGFKSDANRKAAFAKMNDSTHSADKKPEKYIGPDGKTRIRMVPTDKEVIKKEEMQAYRIGHKSMAGNVHAKNPDDAMKQLRKKGVKGDITLTHRGPVSSLPKRRIPTREELDKAKNEASVLKPKSAMDIVKHARTLAKNPRDYMMNRKKYIDKARAKVFKMYPKEAINHSDAHRDAQTHSDGSMSVKKIPSMIKKPDDKHLHLHMKSYHKEKDGQDFAKKHGYKVKNYVKTPSGTRMDIHKEEVNEMIDPMDLRGRPTKKDPYHGKTKYGMKHPLHPLNIQKRKEKEAKKAAAKKEDVDEARVTSTAFRRKTALVNPMVKKNISDMSKDKKYKGNTSAFMKAVKKKYPDEHHSDIVQNMYKKHAETNEEKNVEEALTLQQRMKRGRLMKRLKARIKIGRDRAKRKMANKKTLEKRAMRQARNQIAKKLTRGIPKRELTFARKQEIEKRLDKPALKSRIQRIAKRIFKDVRKAEVQRKKG